MARCHRCGWIESSQIRREALVCGGVEGNAAGGRGVGPARLCSNRSQLRRSRWWSPPPHPSKPRTSGGSARTQSPHNHKRPAVSRHRARCTCRGSRRGPSRRTTCPRSSGHSETSSTGGSESTCRFPRSASAPLPGSTPAHRRPDPRCSRCAESQGTNRRKQGGRGRRQTDGNGSASEEVNGSVLEEEVRANAANGVEGNAAGGRGVGPARLCSNRSQLRRSRWWSPPPHPSKPRTSGGSARTQSPHNHKRPAVSRHRARCTCRGSRRGPSRRTTCPRSSGHSETSSTGGSESTCRFPRSASAPLPGSTPAHRRPDPRCSRCAESQGTNRRKQGGRGRRQTDGNGSASEEVNSSVLEEMVRAMAANGGEGAVQAARVASREGFRLSA